MWISFKEKIKNISARIVEAQKSVRVLDSIRWDVNIEKEFKKNKFKQMPKIGPDYYAKNEIGFEFDKKKEEFESIKTEILQSLGNQDPLGNLLLEICGQYQDVVDLIACRGTKEFWEWSCKLYGSPKDKPVPESGSLIQIASDLYSEVSTLHFPFPIQPTMEAIEAAELLDKKLKEYFNSPVANIRVTDEITSDASAGGDTIKLRQGNKFTLAEVEQLEVHEGWVHIGTTQNGNLQKIAKWLSKSPPRAMATQEGLAFFMEVLTFRATPQRVAQIIDRILAISKAEEGANFIEVFEFYRTEGYTEDESFQSARRVFRGGVLEGRAPFTKDISYLKGLIKIVHFMSAVMNENHLELLPFFFAGKVKVDDIPLLYVKHREGLIDFPTYLPPQFSNFAGLVSWIGLFPLIGLIQGPNAIAHYQKLIRDTL